MIGIDTNVLVRVLTLDDPAQVTKARALFDRLSADHPGYITHLVLIELVWVLASQYGFDRARIALALGSLLVTTGLLVEQPATVERALALFRSSKTADFEDCLIAESCAAAGCEYTATFDRLAARDAGMRLL